MKKAVSGMLLAALLCLSTTQQASAWYVGRWTVTPVVHLVHYRQAYWYAQWPAYYVQWPAQYLYCSSAVPVAVVQGQAHPLPSKWATPTASPAPTATPTTTEPPLQTPAKRAPTVTESRSLGGNYTS